MENYASSLQEKIQKLIDQYTVVKKKLEELQEENNILTEQNLQLIEQVENHTEQGKSSGQAIQALEAQIEGLMSENEALKASLKSYESVANDALTALDVIFPDLEEI